MSAADIVRNFGAQPLEQPLKILAFGKELEQNRELAQGEFITLTQRCQDATDPAQVTGLEDEWVWALYGPKGHA